MSQPVFTSIRHSLHSGAKDPCSEDEEASSVHNAIRDYASVAAPDGIPHPAGRQPAAQDLSRIRLASPSECTSTPPSDSRCARHMPWHMLNTRA